MHILLDSYWEYSQFQWPVFHSVLDALGVLIAILNSPLCCGGLLTKCLRALVALDMDQSLLFGF